MYYPLVTLVHILKDVCCRKEEAEEFAENECLYDFIHKVSMTLHGTLRTDIQFFQIRDFNAVVHYAPAKLRAYYTLLVFMISVHMKEISLETKKHSYIFCPGMFKDIAVKQLRDHPADMERLMLITVPERYLYFPKNLSIILAHEVGHLAGEKIRKREKRHEVFLECSYRIWCLEATKFANDVLSKKIDFKNEKGNYKKDLIYKEEELWEVLQRVNKRADAEEKDQTHKYYSWPSMRRIRNIYGQVSDKYGHIFWEKYGSSLQKAFQKKLEKSHKGQSSDYSNLAESVRSKFFFCEALVEELGKLFDLYRLAVLPNLLKILHHLLSEPISDVLAVLILGLSPYEYLCSMADEIKINESEERFGQDMHKVRIALVVSVMGQLQESHCNNEELGDLLFHWEGVYQRLMPKLKDAPALFTLLMEAHDYEDSLADKIVNVDNYRDFINEERRAVGTRNYDFLNDKAVFEKMCGYLMSCGEEYIRQLTENSEYKHTRQIVADSFRRCTDNTPVELMEEIEAFLEHFENEWMREYF